MKNTRINYQRILVIAGSISLLIYYLFQWVQMISDPILRTSVDFVAYYSAGRIMDERGAAHVYDFAILHQVENQVVGYELGDDQILPYLHMPFQLPLLALMVNENYVSSFLRWDLFLIAIYLPGIFVFSKWILENMPLLAGRGFLAGAVVFFPFFVSLLLGQNTAILFLGVALLGWGIANKKDWYAGLGLALVSLRPHILILLVLPVFVLYRRVFWRFFMIGMVLALGSLFLLGTQGMSNFFNVMFLAAGGKGYGLNVETMINVQGFLTRNLPFIGHEIIRSVGWIVFLGGIPGLFLLARYEKKIDIHVLGRMILICVFIVPHIHYHDLTLLLFPLISAQVRHEIKPVYHVLQKMLHPLLLSFLFLFGLFQETVFPSLLILILFVFLFRKREIFTVNRPIPA